jgi:glycosyltransferase involved in cell wall biosynthesis
VRLFVSQDVLSTAVTIAQERDIVHFVDYEYVSLAHALRRLHARRIGTAVTIHPADFDGSTGGLGGAYKRCLRTILAAALRDADMVISHGPWIQKRLAAQFHLTGDDRRPRLYCQYYPSDGYGRHAFSEPKPTQRERVEILWFGMIRRNKRLDVALEAMACLGTEYGLHVAGHPAEVSVAQIGGWISAAGLQDRVKLSLRYLDPGEVDSAMQHADILLATHDTRFSSASGPVADARCYGVPVVVPEAGQLAQYVRDEDVGVVSSDDGPTGFAAAIRSAAERLMAEPGWSMSILDKAKELGWNSFVGFHARAYDGG